MICDVHAHYIPQKFGDFMGDRWGPRVGPTVQVKQGIAKHPVSDSIADIVGRLELMFQEVERLVAREVPYISLWNKNNFVVAQRTLSGVRVSPLADLLFLQDVSRSRPAAN